MQSSGRFLAPPGKSSSLSSNTNQNWF